MTALRSYLGACFFSVWMVGFGLLRLSAATTQIFFPPGGPEAMPTSRFGEHLVAADLQPDGFADLVVTDWAHRDNRGYIAAYFGSTSGLPDRPDWEQEGTEVGEQHGYTLAVLDVNLDGYRDVVTGRLRRVTHSSIPEMELELGVYRGSSAGLSTHFVPFWTARKPGLGMPHRAMGSMDINFDGHPDLVIGAGDTRVNSNGFPCVLAFFATTNGLASSPDWIAYGKEPGENFGFCFADGGDLDGDGRHELLVGAPWFPKSPEHHGKVYIFHGSATGIVNQATQTLPYPLRPRPGVDSPNDQFFGYAIASLGDLDRKGRSFFAISAPYTDQGEVDEGLVAIYPGMRDGFPPKPSCIIEADKPFSVLGHSLASPGDVNGDGFPDLLVGVPTATSDQNNEGAVLLLPGNRKGVGSRPLWTGTSDRSHWRVGMNLAVGDFDGDGQPEVAATAHHDGTSSAVFVWKIDLKTGGAISPWIPGKSIIRRIEQAWSWSGTGTRAGVVLAGFMLLSTPILLVLLGARRHRLARRAVPKAIREERSRIARDLHDDIGVHLIRLGQLASHPAQAETAVAVKTAIERAIWSFDSSRRSLDDLAAGLMDLSESVMEGSGIQARFDIPADLPRQDLSPEVLDALFRVAQEALTNARKHSGASEVKVRLRVLPGSLEMEISDNGRGVCREIPANERPRGRGLANIERRVREAGGSCRMGPGNPVGFQVRIQVPR